MFSHKSIGLLVLIAALIASAIAASGASATIVQPESEAITVTNSGNTVFITANAYAEESVQCEESSGVLTTPSNAGPPPAGISADTNRVGTGAQSTGSGSVSIPFSTRPTFHECALYVWVNGEWVKTEIPAKVETFGVWTVSATQNGSAVTSGGSLAIAIPPEGATIDIGPGGCKLTVPPAGWAESVDSTYTNANATAVVDGQVHFTDNPEGCGGPVGLAQFEGVYEADNGFTIEN
ncbi:MAG TPA: hypothetical protein VHE08_00900 [Solirubrobacterales bacterium]|nr:hypothetical protein [Solirubrobacterales bacterium]